MCCIHIKDRCHLWDDKNQQSREFYCKNNIHHIKHNVTQRNITLHDTPSTQSPELSSWSMKIQPIPAESRWNEHTGGGKCFLWAELGNLNEEICFIWKSCKLAMQCWLGTHKPNLCSPLLKYLRDIFRKFLGPRTENEPENFLRGQTELPPWMVSLLIGVSWSSGSLSPVLYQEGHVSAKYLGKNILIVQ